MTLCTPRLPAFVTATSLAPTTTMSRCSRALTGSRCSACPSRSQRGSNQCSCSSRGPDRTPSTWANAPWTPSCGGRQRNGHVQRRDPQVPRRVRRPTPRTECQHKKRRAICQWVYQIRQASRASTSSARTGFSQCYSFFRSP